ncbi:MAG: ZIP family metal transporter [Acidobacteria bacterium]|nr:ZIP family metal transporter [Acidobacteriota bacterium]
MSVSPLLLAIALSALGSFLGVCVASLIYLFGDKARDRLVAWLVSYAVGSLLGLSLLHLLPRALLSLPASRALGTLLLGILSFFILEKLVLWRHCHDPHECQLHSSAASLVIIGDAFHTFVDGAIIAAATLTSPWLGLTTALAAAAHEIPQELGDSAILLRAGYGRVQALGLNLLSGLGGILGALFVYVALGQVPTVLPYVIAFAAGSFLYVAMSDLIPSLHRGHIEVNPVAQVLLLSAGLFTLSMV